MQNQPALETTSSDEEKAELSRRLFLRSLGKWSGAAIAAVVVGATWFGSSPEAEAGGWINGRGGYGGGGWINRRGYGGGGWINGRGGGGGGWINRRSYGGGGSWINRW